MTFSEMPRHKEKPKKTKNVDSTIITVYVAISFNLIIKQFTEHFYLFKVRNNTHIHRLGRWGKSKNLPNVKGSSEVKNKTLLPKTHMHLP